ncbi:MAG: hypothetical protein ACR2HM_00085 [Acidimicrobiales bacterium]
MRFRIFAALLLFAASFALAGPATAQTYVGVTPPQVGAVDASGGIRAQVGAVDASGGIRAQLGAVDSAGGFRSQVGADATAGRAGGLAFTGADIFQLVLLAGSAVVLGTIALRLSRNRATP